MIDIIIPKILSLIYTVRWLIMKLHHGLLKVDIITLTPGLFSIVENAYTIVSTGKTEIILSK